MAEIISKLLIILNRSSLYLASLIFLAGIYLLATTPPSSLDSLAKTLNDNFYQANKAQPAENLVFIEIDNSSVRQFGRWPWSREIVADGLAQLKEAEVIGLDILFSEPTTPEADKYLAETLINLPLVGGIFLNGANATNLTQDQLNQLSYSSLGQTSNPHLITSDKAELPLLQLNQSMAALATLNIIADSDHKFRKYPLAFWLDDFAIPSLAVQMWRLTKQQDLFLQGKHPYLGSHLEKNLEVPVDNLNRTLLNFYPNASWKKIPFIELFSEDWDPQSLAGKWVVVGISEAGISDIRATPIGNIPGPLIHLTQLSNFLQNNLIQEASSLEVLLTFITLLLGVWLIWHVSRPWLRSLLYLSWGITAYFFALVLYSQANIWLEVFYIFILLGGLLILGELWLFISTKSEQAYTRNAFESYISPELVDQLVKSKKDLTTGGAKQPLTILFSDLRNFTKTTESLDSEELIELLNIYFTQMIQAIQSQKGTLDKLIGDAVMAFFNAPVEVKNHAYYACLAAAKMMQQLEELNHPYPQDSLKRLAMGIGINTGEALVGNIGASNRFNYTAIGDAVNIASRLESSVKEVNKKYQQNPYYANSGLKSIDILIGEETYKQTRGFNLPLYELEPIDVKGKSSPLRIWALDWRQITQ